MATETPSHPTNPLGRFQLDHPKVSFIRFQWLDFAGVLRARVLLIESAIAMLVEGKQLEINELAVNFTVNHFLMPSRFDGSYRLVPDWSSLRLAASPTNAIVMCALDYITPGSPPNGDLCYRQALERVLRQAREGWNLEFPRGLRGLGHFAVSGLRDPCYQYVEECVHQLQAQGVKFHSLHSEGHRGQYEISLAPLPPAQGINQLILVQDYLKDTFSRHGYMVTMSPKPVASDSQTNGQHMHFSLQPARPDLEASFLAGILKHLPSLCAFCLPQKVSYERVQSFVAGDTVCWGTAARHAPIRKIGPSYWEIRCIDATANMYSTLAAIIGAGLLGIASKEPLTWPDLGPLANEDVSGGEPLPRSLEDALAILDVDAGGLATMIGRPLIDHYIKVKQYELSQVKDMDKQTLRELLIELF
ncbi:hypothetical protein PENNAL_c0009G08538 [Penicillium nalgiovense]|uniref:Glutamine synthetase n=1 Tax=Penicillium nalgiovense TaxID=60175 RepID=A0A1V6YW72_PENNA|nr:hypothetical protein PENNAL_c0009G08538 [Penicillium nalgiovense]